MFPDGSRVVPVCNDNSIVASYCTNGTWTPDPQCTSTNIILLKNWEVHIGGLFENTYYILFLSKYTG